MKTMTPRERLLAAIRFQGPDRVPACPRMWRYMLKHDGSQSEATYLKYADEVGLVPILLKYPGAANLMPPIATESGRQRDVQVSVSRAKDGVYTVVSRCFETPAGKLTERIKCPPKGSYFGIFPNNLVVEHLVKGPDDLPALRCLIRAFLPAPEKIPDYAAFAAEIGERGLTGMLVESALSYNAGDAYPQEQMMVAALDDPDFFNALIDIYHEPVMELVGRSLDRGARLISGKFFYESISMGWSPEIYRRYFLPRVKDLVDLAHAHGAIYFHYDDGKVRDTIPMLREIGVDLLSTICPPPSGDVTPGEARALAGRDMCLNGGIDTVGTMWRGTPEDVDCAVRDAIAAAALPEGGYIAGTSDSITEETPPANFHAFFNAVQKYGKIAAAGGA